MTDLVRQAYLLRSALPNQAVVLDKCSRSSLIDLYIDCIERYIEALSTLKNTAVIREQLSVCLAKLKNVKGI